MISPVFVTSSNIDVVGFSDDVLYIRFHNGGSYCYENVSRATFVSMTEAESVGKYFIANVRGKFPFSKLDSDPFDGLGRRAA